jgi:serine/threonine protein kinase
MTILNHGYKGQVMDIYNKKDVKDKNTLYNEIILSKQRKITLITIDDGKYIKIKGKDIENYNKILEILKNIDDTLVKKFIYISYLFGTKKHNFNNELNGYKNLIKIFKDKIYEHTTIKHGFIFNGRKIYGIIFNNDYYIFLEKCYNILEDIKFTQKTLDKCTNEIMTTLNILNGNNYIHNDIKPNNIILCKNRFKIIDWESSNYIKDQASTFIDTKNGNLVYNHPLKFYNIGVAYFIYQYIYDLDFVNYKYLTNIKKPIEIKEKIEESFNTLLNKYNNLKNIKGKGESIINNTKYIKSITFNEIPENKYYYLKLYDYYSFALTIIYLAEINNLKYNKKLLNPILEKFFIKLI